MSINTIIYLKESLSLFFIWVLLCLINFVTFYLTICGEVMLLCLMLKIGWCKTYLFYNIHVTFVLVGVLGGSHGCLLWTSYLYCVVYDVYLVVLNSWLQTCIEQQHFIFLRAGSLMNLSMVDKTSGPPHFSWFIEPLGLLLIYLLNYS